VTNVINVINVIVATATIDQCQCQRNHQQGTNQPSPKGIGKKTSLIADPSAIRQSLFKANQPMPLSPPSNATFWKPNTKDAKEGINQPSQPSRQF